MPRVLFHILLLLLSSHWEIQPRCWVQLWSFTWTAYTLFLSISHFDLSTFIDRPLSWFQFGVILSRQFLFKNPGTIMHEVLRDLYLRVRFIGVIHTHEFHTYPLYILHKPILYYIQNLINNGKFFPNGPIILSQAM